MARIVKRKTKRGVSYQTTIRQKGFDTVTRTFDTKGEALVWAATIEQDMKDQRYYNPRRAMGISLSQPLTKLLSTISEKKA